MKRTLTILLLIAALIHPIAHVSHDAVICPAVHSTLAEVPRPVAGALRVIASVPEIVPDAPPAAERPVDVPARAPPVA